MGIPEILIASVVGWAVGNCTKGQGKSVALLGLANAQVILVFWWLLVTLV